MPDVASLSDVQTLDNFNGGRWMKAQATEFFGVRNPARRQVLYKFKAFCEQHFEELARNRHDGSGLGA